MRQPRSPSVLRTIDLHDYRLLCITVLSCLLQFAPGANPRPCKMSNGVGLPPGVAAAIDFTLLPFFVLPSAFLFVCLFFCVTTSYHSILKTIRRRRSKQMSQSVTMHASMPMPPRSDLQLQLDMDNVPGTSGKGNWLDGKSAWPTSSPSVRNSAFEKVQGRRNAPDLRAYCVDRDTAVQVPSHGSGPGASAPAGGTYSKMSHSQTNETIIS